MVCVARFLPGPSNRTRCARLRRIPRAEPTASATELAPASYGMALHAHLRLVAPIRTIPLAPLESAAVEPVRLVRQCHRLRQRPAELFGMQVGFQVGVLGLDAQGFAPRHFGEVPRIEVAVPGDHGRPGNQSVHERLIVEYYSRRV